MIANQNLGHFLIAKSLNPELFHIDRGSCVTQIESYIAKEIAAHMQDPNFAGLKLVGSRTRGGAIATHGSKNKGHKQQGNEVMTRLEHDLPGNEDVRRRCKAVQNGNYARVGRPAPPRWAGVDWA